jgi:predicted Zn-dependent protease
VARRWLIRDGVVAQPLADSLWARDSEGLSPGAARRGHRHVPPGPRSTHLELLPGDTAEADLGAGSDGGLWIGEASRGRLDPASGAFSLEVPCARRLRGGVPADAVGPFRLRGTVAGLLSRITAVGAERRFAGAGWCAKGGQKMAVWATAPALRLEGVEVAP